MDTGHRKTGRPKLRWSDVIRKDMMENGVKIEEAQDRRMWRLKTRCSDPKNREKAEQEEVSMALNRPLRHANISDDIYDYYLCR